MGVHRRGSAPGHDLMRWPPPASAIVSVLKSKMTPVMSQPRLDCRHALACTPIRPSSLRSIPFTLRHRTPAGPRHTDPRSSRRVRHVVRAGQATPPPRSDPTPSGRTFIFAVDGTRDAEEGLRWLIRAMTKKGASPARGVPKVPVIQPGRSCMPAGIAWQGAWPLFLSPLGRIPRPPPPHPHTPSSQATPCTWRTW